LAGSGNEPSNSQSLEMIEKVHWKTDAVSRYSISQIVYLALTLLLFGGAAIFRFKLPQVPFIDPDVRGYLAPALLVITGHGFQHVEDRSFVYPGFVFLILRIFGQVNAITAVQHLFALGAGGFILAAWNRAGLFIGKRTDFLYRVAGLSVSALFLFNTSALRLEYLIRPEAIFPFFISLHLWLNIEFVRCRFLAKEQEAGSVTIQPVKEGDQAPIFIAVLMLFNAGLLFYLKPGFYLASSVGTAPVLVWLADRTVRLKDKIQVLSAALASLLFLLLLPDHLVRDSDTDGKTFLPATLFLIHAGIIQDQLRLDIERKAATPYSAEFLTSTYHLLSQEMNLSKQTRRYHSLGFDPDYLMYRDSFDQKFARSLGANAVETRVKFYYYYYLRAWTFQPVRMLWKIGIQLSILYNSFSKASPYKLEDHDSFATSYTDNLELFTTKLSGPEIQTGLLSAFEKSTDQLRNSKARLNQPRPVSWANRFLARSFTFFIILAIGMGCLMARNAVLRARYGEYLTIILLFYGYSFFNSLGIAVIHTLEISRYLTSQIIYCLLPQVMMIYLLIHFVRRRSGKARLPEVRG
jgi:hypothetical protein